MPVTEDRLTASCDIRRIVKGEAVTITIELFDQISKQVQDLTDADTITVRLPSATAGESIDIELGAGVEVLTDTPGRIALTIMESQTLLMMAGCEQSFQIELVFTNGTKRIVIVHETLDVLAPLF